MSEDRTVKEVRRRLLYKAAHALVRAELAENQDEMTTQLIIAEVYKLAAQVCVRVMNGEAEPMDDGESESSGQ